jgi:hypothetical protein
MRSVLFYALLFVLVFSILVFIVLFGPAPRFRYRPRPLGRVRTDVCRNTPIGVANRFLTHDVPRVLGAVDGTVTGGRAGKVCGYVFSAGTPLIMVIHPQNILR